MIAARDLDEYWAWLARENARYAAMLRGSPDWDKGDPFDEEGEE